MNFKIKHSAFSTITERDLHGLLSLRYEVFKKRLGWDLETQGTTEQDDYDTNNAEYLYATSEGANVIGCWRLISTTERYMLKDTFSVLLGCESAPSCEKKVQR